MARKEKQEEVLYNEKGERVVYRDAPKKKSKILPGCLGLVLLMLIIGACAAAMGGGEDTKEKSSSKESTTTSEKKETKKATNEKNEENKKLKIGDEVTKADVKFKPTKAYYTDERNEFEDTKADKVLVIEMDITNNGKEDIPVGADVTAYADGKKLETYPVNDTLMDSLSPGRSISGNQGFAIVGEPKNIELEFEPFLSGEKAIYEVNPQ
ncbi:DUF4352 domain-containing protein [Macrococcoides caseolyticum]|uniref:DUF4352 domain-containing protein n=1 Tax=Macrococcoides caseolyticum TaxID=69966 RepID=UPI001E5F4A26|nr:DUF4352 domain-containing protein [Macrococcus caseolyticus]